MFLWINQHTTDPGLPESLPYISRRLILDAFTLLCVRIGAPKDCLDPSESGTALRAIKSEG